MPLYHTPNRIYGDFIVHKLPSTGVVLMSVEEDGVVLPGAPATAGTPTVPGTPLILRSAYWNTGISSYTDVQLQHVLTDGITGQLDISFDGVTQASIGRDGAYILPGAGYFSKSGTRQTVVMPEGSVAPGESARIEFPLFTDEGGDVLKGLQLTQVDGTRMVHLHVKGSIDGNTEQGASVHVDAQGGYGEVEIYGGGYSSYIGMKAFDTAAALLQVSSSSGTAELGVYEGILDGSPPAPYLLLDLFRIVSPNGTATWIDSARDLEFRLGTIEGVHSDPYDVRLVSTGTTAEGIRAKSPALILRGKYWDSVGMGEMTFDASLRTVPFDDLGNGDLVFNVNGGDVAFLSNLGVLAITSLNLLTGTALPTPIDGDVWYDGGFNFRENGVTKQLGSGGAVSSPKQLLASPDLSVWSVGVTSQGVISTVKTTGTATALVIPAPDATLYAVTIDNDGVLSTAVTTDAETGLITTEAPNGLRWKLTVTNAGAIETVPLEAMPWRNMSFYFDGGMTAGDELVRYILAVPLTIPANFSTARVLAGDLPTATAVFSVRKNEVEFGTITIEPNGAYTLSCPETSFGAGELLSIVAPDPADLTLARISITFPAQEGTDYGY